MVRLTLTKIILIIIAVILFAIAAYGFFLIWKINRTGNKISTASQENNINASVFDTLKNLARPNPIKLDGYNEGRVNILLLGIAGVGKPGTNLTDTIMIASFNTKTNQVALLSLPRDLYVENPEINFKDKINTLYPWGVINYPNDPQEAISPLIETIKNITSLDMNYWAVLNFDGFQKAIDDIGGINIMNERDIYDPTYPGPNYSYDPFRLAKGFQHLDGNLALKYARMRHNDPEGDFGRAKRQQQVIQAAKNKIFSTGTLLNVPALNNLFNTLGNNVKTNIPANQFGDFLELVKKTDTSNVNNMVVDAWDKNSLLIATQVSFGNFRASVLVPRAGNWSEVHELAKNIFDMNYLNRRRQAIADENASVAIINKSGNAQVLARIQRLLSESFGYKNISLTNDKNIATEDNSVVYDSTGGAKPFTLDELVSKLPAAASYNPGDNYKSLVSKTNPDLVVVIGKDLIPKFSMVQESFEEYNNSNDTNE